MWCILFTKCSVYQTKIIYIATSKQCSRRGLHCKMLATSIGSSKDEKCKPIVTKLLGGNEVYRKIQW